MNIQETLNQLEDQINYLQEENERLKNEKQGLQLMDYSEAVVDEDIVMNFDLNKDVRDKVATNLLGENYKQIDKQALLVVIGDVSGSMGMWEKYIGRSYVSWIEEIIKRKYKGHVHPTQYVAFNTEAWQTDKESFHKKGASGGTIVSTGFRLANQIIEDYYYENEVDVFIVNVSDGDNLSSDNKRVRKLLSEKLIKKTKNIIHLEPNQHNRHSTVALAFNGFEQDEICKEVIRRRTDIYNALDDFARSL